MSRRKRTIEVRMIVIVLVDLTEPGLTDTLSASGRPEGSVKFLPLRARKKDGIVLLDAISGNPLAVLLIDPW